MGVPGHSAALRLPSAGRDRAQGVPVRLARLPARRWAAWIVRLGATGLPAGAFLPALPRGEEAVPPGCRMAAASVDDSGDKGTHNYSVEELPLVQWNP